MKQVILTFPNQWLLSPPQ